MLQILGIKRIHEVETRRDTFALVLSDGYVSHDENIEKGVLTLYHYFNIKFYIKFLYFKI